jgi:hydroxymethylpyrimidine pyrophosphatase-like HAD family hydrolase
VDGLSETWGPPQLIALDIDGTILHGETPVSARVLAAVKNAVEAGVHVVLATGRPMISTWPVVTELGLVTGSVLCSNGAVWVDAASGELRLAHRFDPAPLVAELSAVLPDAIFAVERPGFENLVTGEFPGFGTVPDLLVDHATLVAEPVPRLTVWWNGFTAAELGARVSAVELAEVNYTLDSSGPWLVAVAKGISKGSALERLRVDLGVPADATLAVGDGDNDIEMLRWAALGVAMGQANDTVKAAAHEVTGTFDEDGVADVLERWF